MSPAPLLIKGRFRPAFLFFALGFAPLRAQQWPDLSSMAHITGGGEKDAALIVGAEDYAFVARVPGARANANDWQAYLTGSLKVPAERVALLRDNEATLEKMRKFAAQKAAQVEPGGTLWFVFIGHGAASKEGKDGFLIGTDAQRDSDGLYARSLAQSELLNILAKGRQATTAVFIDACFSGKTIWGDELIAGLQPLKTVVIKRAGIDARTVLMTAAGADQFAGPLPKARAMRPAFSYLALGALRGWAADSQGQVNASAVVDFARRALAMEKGRSQTPELAAGSPATVLSRGHEPSPDLARIDREGGIKVEDFKVSSPPVAPQSATPTAAVQKKPLEGSGEERVTARDSDWARLAGLFALTMVSQSLKATWAQQFAGAYLQSPGIESSCAAQLSRHLPPGPTKKAVDVIVDQARSRGEEGLARARERAQVQDQIGGLQEDLGRYRSELKSSQNLARDIQSQPQSTDSVEAVRVAREAVTKNTEAVEKTAAAIGMLREKLKQLGASGSLAKRADEAANIQDTRSRDRRYSDVPSVGNSDLKDSGGGPAMGPKGIISGPGLGIELKELDDSADRFSQYRRGNAEKAASIKRQKCDGARANLKLFPEQASVWKVMMEVNCGGTRKTGVKIPTQNEKQEAK